jgi:MFS family permease
MWGRIIERFPVRYVFATVALFMSASSVLFLTADTTVEALLYSSLFGMSIGGILVVPPVAFANYFGRRSLGAIRGVTEPFASLGQAFGVLLSGAVFDATGSYQIAFLTFATFGAATVVIMLLAKPPRHAPAAVGVP